MCDLRMRKCRDVRMSAVKRTQVLEEDVLSVSERRADALQQQVERLKGNDLRLSLFLIPVFASGAQRETQVKLPHANTQSYTLHWTLRMCRSLS